MDEAPILKSVSSIWRSIKRVLGAIGHEIAETIRFGAVPSATAPIGQPAQAPAIGAVMGLEQLAPEEDAEKESAQPD